MPGNVEVARRAYEAALAGDLSALGAILDPEVRWHGGDPEASGACRNREETLGWMGRALAGPGPGELLDVVGTGDAVVVIFRRRTDDGGPGTPVATLTTFRDGRAIEVVHHPNPEVALAELHAGRGEGAPAPGRRP